MTEQAAQHLADELRRRFDAQTVDLDEISPGKFRFAVVSQKFIGIAPLRRQDLVWEAVDEIVSREENLDISLILTFAPEDVELSDV